MAIVTGGSGNIGSAIVKEFLKEGANVIFTYFQNEQSAKMLLDECNSKFGRKPFDIKCDVRNVNDVKKVVEFAINMFNKIDILVNNAGIAANESIEDTTDEMWKNVIETNLKGTYHFARMITPIMKKQKYGKIISISSIGGVGGTSNQAVFGSTKSGLIGFTRSLSVELAPYNINVNSISPGIIKIDKFPEEHYKKLAKIIPLRRVGKIEDIAKGVLFLSSQDSDFITGHNLIIDGGHSTVIFY